MWRALRKEGHGWLIRAASLSERLSCPNSADWKGLLIQNCAARTQVYSTQISDRQGNVTTGAAASEGSIATPQRPKRAILYRGRWMVPFRVLVRLKIFQLGGVAAMALPLGTFLSKGGVSAASLGISAALLLGCGASAAAVNYYGRRYVGELSLVKQRTGEGEAQLCISVLDFWGNREVRLCARWHAVFALPAIYQIRLEAIISSIFLFPMSAHLPYERSSADSSRRKHCVQDNIVPLARVVPPMRGVGPVGVREMARQPLLPIAVEGDRQFYISLRFGRLLAKQSLLDVLQGTRAPPSGPVPGSKNEG